MFCRALFVVKSVRAIGGCCGNMKEDDFRQISLFEMSLDKQEQINREREEKIQAAKDTIRQKLGFTSIQKGTSLTKGSRVVERSKRIGGHSAGGLEGLE